MGGTREHFLRSALSSVVAGGAVAAATSCAGAHDLESQRKLVRDFAEAFNSRKFERLREILSPTYINHNPHVPSGVDATINFYKNVAAQLPDAKLTVEDIITEGYKVVARFTLSSKQGKGTVVDIWRVENGKFAEHWDTAS